VASKVTVVINDDIDGSADAETVSFGLDGMSYEIDLSEKNRAKLDKALAPYIENGHRVARSRRQTGLSRSRSGRVDRAAIRTWAKENGLQVSDRGRISADVLEQYEAAH
jgi:hypothetical protein